MLKPRAATKLYFALEKCNYNYIKYIRLSHNLRTSFKLRCDERFTHAFTARGCVFKEITLVDSENATACSKRTLKTTVATQLY